MIPGFGQALADKYAILGQHADAAMTGANAAMIGARSQANLANANAGEVAANAASQRAAQGAQTGETKARTSTIEPLAQSTIGLQGRQGAYYGDVGSAALMHGNAALTGAASESDLVHQGQIPNYQADTNRTEMQTNQDFGSSPVGDGAANFLGGQMGFHAGSADVLRPLTDQELHMIHQHLCMGGTVHAMGGLSQVPGQQTPAAQVGTQASDQVPAMLAPDEAVLNKHGADIIGRDKIAAANAIGNHMAKQERQAAPPAGKSKPGKGMPAPKGKAAPKHFATGTSDATNKDPNADEMKALQNFQMPPQQNQPPDRYWPSNGRRDKSSMMTQNFASGTHQVAHGKSAKTPTKVDPAAAMALLQMAKGGGGMPPPQQPGGMPAPQGNPMPMQPPV